MLLSTILISYVISLGRVSPEELGKNPFSHLVIDGLFLEKTFSDKICVTFDYLQLLALTFFFKMTSR